MVWLLKRGAFAASSSRPRLFHAAHASLEHVYGFGGRVLAPGEYETLRADLATLDDEWAYVKSLYPTLESTKVGRKGVLYCYPKTVW
jgi:hypothetical protein